LVNPETVCDARLVSLRVGGLRDRNRAFLQMPGPPQRGYWCLWGVPSTPFSLLDRYCVDDTDVFVGVFARKFHGTFSE
jgi:hypothetical protein